MLLDLSKEFDAKRGEEYFNKMLKDGAKIEIKKVHAKRTVDQNAYFHVCIKFFCLETGYTMKEAKIVLAREFGSFMIYKHKEHSFIRSTSELDTSQMTQYIDWIRNIACYETLGVYVMTPEEYLTNKFEIDQQLQYIRD